MACYHPSFIQKSFNPRTGEVKSKFLGSLQNCLECNSVLKEQYQGEKSLDFIPRTYQDGFYHDFIQIPCGKCIGCRMDYSRSWADRMTYHAIGREEQSYFLTLTYDDSLQDPNDYIPIYDLYSLNYDHVTEFIKRLRNKFRDDQIDYYYSGEYGDISLRNHFHMILYNLDIPDLKYYKCNDLGEPLYTSEILENLWQRGFVVVGKFNWLSAAYCASYVEKKRDGRKLVEYTALGLEPEKCRCSRRPGIAYDYYIENYASLWKNGGLSVPRSVNSSGKLGLPRYFRKLAQDKLIGYDEFQDWQKRSLDHQNIVNPLKLDNSSFDLQNVRKMLEFEEREILRNSTQRNF